MALPREISRLAQLARLALRADASLGAPRRRLDLAELSSLRALQLLQASEFAVDALPAHGSWPGTLSVVQLVDCGLQAFPELAGLPDLMVVDLRNNAITSLPD